MELFRYVFTNSYNGEKNRKSSIKKAASFSLREGRTLLLSKTAPSTLILLFTPDTEYHRESKGAKVLPK
jgi:hypothetical protein